MTLEAESLFVPRGFLPQGFLYKHKKNKKLTQTHLEVPAQGVYFGPQSCVFLKSFVLLLSLIVGFLQSLSQLIVEPESTQKTAGPLQ